MLHKQKPGVMKMRSKEGLDNQPSHVSGFQNRWAHSKMMVIFLGPATLFYFCFVLYSVVYNIFLSFYNWNGFETPKFVYLANFIRLFNDEIFWRSLGNNLVMVICAVTVMLGMSIVLALILNMRLPARYFFRTVYFLPVVISIIVIGLLWSRIFEPNNGPLNLMLKGLNLEILAHSWLGDKHTALGSVIAVWIWRHVGYGTVLLLAGLQAIPSGILESARIDGADGWKIVRYITLPLLKPVIVTVALWSVILSFKVFPLIYIMTKGGPYYHTEVLNTYLYRLAFQNYDFGTASANATILLAIMVCCALVSRKLNE
jgi:raffinose/stachyose/melibiose transport system permease protein